MAETKAPSLVSDLPFRSVGFKNSLIQIPSVHLFTEVPGLSRWVGIVEHSICRRKDGRSNGSPTFTAFTHGFIQPFTAFTRSMNGIGSDTTKLICYDVC